MAKAKRGSMPTTRPRADLPLHTPAGHRGIAGEGQAMMSTVSRPRRVCLGLQIPGGHRCPQLATPGDSRCVDCRSEMTRVAKAVEVRPARHALYQSAEWQRMRRWARRNMERVCGMCGQQGGKLILDHRQAVQNAPELVWKRSNLWYVCSGCPWHEIGRGGPPAPPGEG
jgi:hypothetical protein